MTREEYNAKVQELQAMWGDASRVEAARSKGGTITESYFQVYWDGRWHTLGNQRDPFTSEASYEWDETRELKLRGLFAGALIHS